MTYQLPKTGIEYGTHSWSIFSGCLHKQQGVCPVPHCWAEGMSKRQRDDFHKPHLITKGLLAPLHRKKPARILVNFMGDLFGDWLDPEMVIGQILSDKHILYTSPDKNLKTLVIEVIKQAYQHTFIFLTKAPWNLAKWGKFPDNCQVGVSACNYGMALAGAQALGRIQARVKWLSYEPLYDQQIHERNYQDPALSPTTLVCNGISWIVIGAQTKPDRFPSSVAVESIIASADKAGAKVFLKNNLKAALPVRSPFYRAMGSHGSDPLQNIWKYRQEVIE